MSGKLRKIISIVLSMTLVFVSCSIACGKDRFISDIKLCMDAKADEKLEQSGLNVIYANLNKTANANNNIYLGYSYGEEGITNIIASEKKTSKINVSGIEYTLASEINLNEGSEGTNLYLYYTKDEKAGSYITGLEVKTQYNAGDDIGVNYSNEYKVMLLDDGEFANLEEGKEGYVTYLLLSRIDDEEKHPVKDGTNIDTQKGEERDVEENIEKDVVDDRSSEEIETLEKTVEENKKEIERDAKIKNGVLYGGIAFIIFMFVFVLAIKKRGGKKDEK